MPKELSMGPGDSVCVRGCCVSSAGMSCEISGAPHISQDRSDGWLRKVHRGHWNEASGSGLPGAPPDAPTCDGEDSEAGLGRTGSGVCSAGLPGRRLAALDMAAFRTCVRVGLMPHARHGASGVCAFAVAGSKLEGTGFEKLQIVQTHVAVAAGGGSTGDIRG